MTMNQYAISTPEGSRDRLFAATRLFRQNERRIRNLLEARGYDEIITPSLEYYDVFVQAGSSIGQEKMYKLTDRNGRLLVLRPDNTTPIARVVTTKLDGDALPLRLYYIQKVHRAGSFHRGHSTEVMQAGAELLGAKGMIADLDILTAAFEALAAVKGEPFRIELGHAAIYKALISSLDVDAETEEAIRSHIENKSYAALGDVLEPFRDRDAYQALKAMPTLFGGGEVLEEVARLTDNSEVLRAVEYLRDLIDAITTAGFGENVMIDLGLVQEIDYYTGMMFRGYMGGAGAPVLVGGRYDNLCEKFGKDIPATGFAIDIDALSDSVALKQEQTAEELVFCGAGYLKLALDYIRVSGNRAELAPCDTLEQAEEIAKKKGYRTLVTFDRNGIRKTEVQA
ncbi:MAG TPA: ATP phosphoribosyltransferase regulatory subunit [Candidatus Butyricicoccus stercorigallinarum]|nr:ATP phosphoribosyltransferase regulatory subunit [Candidatus Butyricicoccus stercorigallinarum]